jgi:(p)ppGpp synthase/HD superfamily hydrolase
MEAPLDFDLDSPLVTRAYAFAREAHGEPDSDGPTAAHPVEVGRLLHSHGFDEQVVAAGLLHDVVEHTHHSLDEIERRFGRPVGELVGALTEDASIGAYEARKADHRRHLARSDERAAAIFAADKLAKAREMAEDRELPPRAKLDHYVESLRMLRRAHPDVPMLDDLERELTWFRSAAAR